MESVKRGPGQHHGDLRNTLIRVAEGLIDERGVLGWGMADASRRAGVSVAAPYKHFSDRDALLAAVAAEGLNDLYRIVRGDLQDSPEPLEGFVRFTRRYLRFAADQRAQFAAAFQVQRDKTRYPDLADTSQRIFQLLAPLAEQLVDQPLAEELVLAIGALTHGFAVLDLPHPRIEDAAESGVKALVSGFLLRPGSDGSLREQGRQDTNQVRPDSDV